MMTEEQLQKYERSVRFHDKHGRESTAHEMAHLCQEVRALQKRIAELEEEVQKLQSTPSPEEASENDGKP